MLKKLYRLTKHLFFNYNSIAKVFLKAEKRMGTFEAELQEKAMEYRVSIAKMEDKLATTETEAQRAGTASRQIASWLSE